MIYMNVLTCCSLRYHWRSTYFINVLQPSICNIREYNVVKLEHCCPVTRRRHIYVQCTCACTFKFTLSSYILLWFLDIHIIKLIHNFNHMFSMYISRYSPSPSAISPWWGRSPPPPPLQGRLPWAASRWPPPPSSGSNCHQNHRRPDFYPSGFLDLSNDTPRLAPCYNHNMAR